MWRGLSVGALLMALFAAPALARPVAVADLVEMAGVPEDLVLRLVQHRGFGGELGAGALAELSSAGFSDAFLSRLVELTRPAPEIDGVTYRVVDGVLRVQGEGQEPAADASGSSAVGAPAVIASPEPLQPSGEAPAVPPALVIDGTAWLAGEQANPYPAGAVGWGSAVFLPARYGNPASSFGRTIVSMSPRILEPCGTCCTAASMPVLVDAASMARSEGRLIPIRTSRGTIWVPN